MKIHFIGIDGISMSAIAKIMQEKGHSISGSDLKMSPLSKRLVDKGATFFDKQVKENITKIDPDIVVYTAAINKNNEELIAAKSSKAKIFDRATFLGELAKGYSKSIAISGSHGKTTTTAMLTYALLKTDTDPTALVGGELADISGNVIIGQSDIFVTEACEYVESFLKVYPYIGIVLNIDKDHLDYFRDLDHIISSFEKFSDNIIDNGFLIINNEDPNTAKVIEHFNGNLITFGLCDKSMWHVKNINHKETSSLSKLYKKDSYMGDLELLVPGNHNILNALAVIATCDILGVDIKLATKALKGFKGTHRRFEQKGVFKGATLIDDYAHHPKEIKTTLEAVKKSFPNKKLIVVFQPHTYSRTKTLLYEFSTAFNLVDKLLITPTYPAREPYDASGDSHTLIKAIKENIDQVSFVDGYKEAAQFLFDNLSSNDIIITMGAGPVDEVIDILLNFNQE